MKKLKHAIVFTGVWILISAAVGLLCWGFSFLYEVLRPLLGSAAAEAVIFNLGIGLAVTLLLSIEIEE